MKMIVAALIGLLVSSEAVASTHKFNVLEADRPSQDVDITYQTHGRKKSGIAFFDEQTGLYLLANFGSQETGMSALMGHRITHSTVLERSGWQASHVNGYEQTALAIDHLSFYAPSDLSGEISIPWPESFKEAVVEVHLDKVMPNRNNQILLKNKEKEILLWKEPVNKSGVVYVKLNGLNQMQNANLIFRENSGRFIIKRVWVK